MGAIQSLFLKKFVANEEIAGQGAEAVEIIRELRLSDRDISLFYRQFEYLDLDKSGSISIAEMFSLYTMESTALNQQIFSLFDEDNSGEINFLEFVCANWNFLTLSRETIGGAAFLMFDNTGSRSLSLRTLRTLLETVHTKKLESIPAVFSIYDNLGKDFVGFLSFNQFVKWTAENPALMTPLFAIQVALANKLLGRSYWEKKQIERFSNPDMRHANFIFKFQIKMREIHAKAQREKELRRLNKEYESIRGDSNARGTKQDLLMNTFGLAGPPKGSDRKGVNVPDRTGDMIVGMSEFTDVNDLKEKMKIKPKSADLVVGGLTFKKSRKTVYVANDTPPSSATSEVGAESSAGGPKKSRKTMVSGKSSGSGGDGVAGGEEAGNSANQAATRTTRKTIVSKKEAARPSQLEVPTADVAATVPTPTATAASPAVVTPSTSSQSGGPRKGRSTFVSPKNRDAAAADSALEGGLTLESTVKLKPGGRSTIVASSIPE